MLLAVIIELWITWKVWRALKKIEAPSAIASGNSYTFFRALQTSHVLHSTIRLFALNFYEVIVDEAEEQLSNCFSRIITNIYFKQRFRLILDVLLNFALERKDCKD